MADSKKQGRIVLEGLTKRFGDTVAVRDVDLVIESGEFFSLLGPSGCGKTTTLRLLAGFEDPSSGRITLDGRDVTWESPLRRNVNMVFQSYALFPHMTAYENVGFGLRIRRVPKREIDARVREALEVVRMSDYANRRPSQLSGGQQQRVAVARALVMQPAAVLLDEPLGALDLKLRKEMQAELRHIHARTGMTFVYVTHDQEEAMAMSDRIAVMNGGVVEQVATPRDLYEHPASPFVAGFVGNSSSITVRSAVEQDGAVIADMGADGRIVVDAKAAGGRRHFRLVLRPEKMSVCRAPSGTADSFTRGTVIEAVYLGEMMQFTVDLVTGDRVVVRELNDGYVLLPKVGEQVTVTWPSASAVVIDDA
jgi:spermidine/putrescine transport system ATP-binding protein